MAKNKWDLTDIDLLRAYLKIREARDTIGKINDRRVEEICLHLDKATQTLARIIE